MKTRKGVRLHPTEIILAQFDDLCNPLDAQQMKTHPYNSFSFRFVRFCAWASVETQRRGWPNVRPEIDVNSDQVLNTGKPDKPWMN